MFNFLFFDLVEARTEQVFHLSAHIEICNRDACKTALMLRGCRNFYGLKMRNHYLFC
jgi:hypothetical protein|tara:strand:+ start:67588 stop:67758 length:171 start_codon:yes stop_codon:yes gene_type:complete